MSAIEQHLTGIHLDIAALRAAHLEQRLDQIENAWGSSHDTPLSTNAILLNRDQHFCGLKCLDQWSLNHQAKSE